MGRYMLHIWVPIVVLLLVGVAIFLTSRDATFQLLESKGLIAQQQKNLFIFATLIMTGVSAVVFALLAIIARQYSAARSVSNRYSPEWASSKALESLWWGIPIAIIIVLAAVTWQSSHALDPYKPIVSDKTPVNVQVIALQWRWLFIYPDHSIASLNELVVPVDRPINFVITSDAPMNSFWIPQLGGQVYAMSGMSTRLHLQADRVGVYRGTSANISGRGHADMKFTTRAVSETEYTEWISKTTRTNKTLTDQMYNEIRKPTIDRSSDRYVVSNAKLYDDVIFRYTQGHMSHGGAH